MATVTGLTAERMDDVIPISGTAAQLAADNPVAEPGQLVYATDSKRFGFGDGVTPWLSLLDQYATELDYAESTVVQNGIGATAVDLTGLTVDFTVTAGRPVWVEVELPMVYTGANTAGTTLVAIASLCDAANVEKRNAYVTLPPNYFAAPMSIKERFSTPGTYHRKVRMKKTGTGTFNHNFVATDVATITATRFAAP